MEFQTYGPFRVPMNEELKSDLCTYLSTAVFLYTSDKHKNAASAVESRSISIEHTTKI